MFRELLIHIVMLLCVYILSQCLRSHELIVTDIKEVFIFTKQQTIVMV